MEHDIRKYKTYTSHIEYGSKKFSSDFGLLVVIVVYIYIYKPLAVGKQAPMEINHFYGIITIDEKEGTKRKETSR